MTKRYICNLCGEPCILEVEENTCAPFACPWNETDYPEWELLKEEDKNNESD